MTTATAAAALTTILERAIRTLGTIRALAALRPVGAVERAIVAILGLAPFGRRALCRIVHGRLIPLGAGLRRFGARYRPLGRTRLAGRFGAALAARLVTRGATRAARAATARRCAGFAGGLRTGHVTRRFTAQGLHPGRLGGRAPFSVRLGTAGGAGATRLAVVARRGRRLGRRSGRGSGGGRLLRARLRRVEIRIVVASGFGGRPRARAAGRTFRFGHSTTASGTGRSRSVERSTARACTANRGTGRGLKDKPFFGLVRR